MRKAIFIFLAFCCSFQVLRAQETKPELLFQPANWEFERFSLPPSFAPAITFKGFEELRFAPGIFKKDSADYFTYIFVADVEAIKLVTEKELLDYVIHYYKGLCATVAKDKKLSIDTSLVKATIRKSEANAASGPGGPSGGPIFESTVNLFGVFADGAPVTLNLEIQVFQDLEEKRTFLFFIASPQPKTSPIWKKLYQLRKSFNVPLPLLNKLPGAE